MYVDSLYSHVQQVIQIERTITLCMLYGHGDRLRQPCRHCSAARQAVTLGYVRLAQGTVAAILPEETLLQYVVSALLCVPLYFDPYTCNTPHIIVQIW